MFKGIHKYQKISENIGKQLLCLNAKDNIKRKFQRYAELQLVVHFLFCRIRLYNNVSLWFFYEGRHDQNSKYIPVIAVTGRYTSTIRMQVSLNYMADLKRGSHLH